MNAILKREAQSYFLSPIAYIFIGTFMLITGIFFSLSNILGLSTNFASTLGSVTFVFMIIVPILTMKLFSQEKKDKTDQLLLTSSVSVWDIVLGKFLAAALVFLVTLAVSLIFPIIISMFGNAVFGEMVCAYTGFFLLGLSMIAIGMFISTTTDSQVVATILTAAILLLLWVGDAALDLVQSQVLKNVLSWFSLFNRLEIFILGKLSLTNAVYYFSFIGLFLFFSYINVEKRRWT